MMEGRENAACTIFEGKVVVPGGYREQRISAPIVGSTRLAIRRMRIRGLKSV